MPQIDQTLDISGVTEQEIAEFFPEMAIETDKEKAGVPESEEVKYDTPSKSLTSPFKSVTFSAETTDNKLIGIDKDS